MINKDQTDPGSWAFVAGTRAALTAIGLLVISSGCNLPSRSSEESEPRVDPDARPYLMYYDSSANPAQNVLQVRRFTGHIHLADLEPDFGDPGALPLDPNCNYAGGPAVIDDELVDVSFTRDLVGVNVVSLSPDGTESSAFDLDGDRIVDILDIRLPDNRRFTFLTEHPGLGAFLDWLQGRDPYCSEELLRELGLESLTCGEGQRGSSDGAGFAGLASGGGPGGGYSGSIGYLDDLMCAGYGSRGNSPIMSALAKSRLSDGFLDRVRRAISGTPVLRATLPEYVDPVSPVEVPIPNRPETTRVSHSENPTSTEDRYETRDANTGRLHSVTRAETKRDPSGAVVSQTIEIVYPDGTGVRSTTVYDANGNPKSTNDEDITVAPEDVGRSDYDPENTNPPPGSSSEVGAAGPQGHPGDAEGGGDSTLGAICNARSNYQSGVEQVAATDPASFSVSCDSVVGGPESGHCVIISSASIDDFRDVVADAANGCDPFMAPDAAGNCEASDQVSRLKGRMAEIWSLGLLEGVQVCSGPACDPAEAVTMKREALSGQVEIPACEPQQLSLPPDVLEPSEENCPPGTYYAPVTNRCIEIQLPLPGAGGSGGSGAGSCNLSVAKCSSQGMSFDANSCQCVPIQ